MNAKTLKLLLEIRICQEMTAGEFAKYWRMIDG